MFLSMVEYLIPKPLPFMRLGLANLPILLSLALFTPRNIMLLIGLKVLGQGLVNGTLFSYIFLFSAAGSFCSGIVMIVAAKICKQKISLVGICVLGALASNTVQLFIARHLIFGASAYVIGPPFLLIGLISAVILGIFAEKFAAQSRWYNQLLNEASSEHS
jgi:heptaprenyl diphosphate synthase